MPVPFFKFLGHKAFRIHGKCIVIKKRPINVPKTEQLSSQHFYKCNDHA